ncbi:MAG: Xaa-Pro peptidase family protein [Gammaproteobacteria bacterium]|nr:MAG: Xaa-Pro peptidase family protein [Gammaproteobacteria bacterium]
MSPQKRRPAPGKFTRREFERRAERACELMTREKLDGLLVTSEANVEYLSGFTTQFAWNTPTRPWYFLLRRNGRGVAIIPEIGLSNWQATSWVDEILTWPSPRPENEGLDLLTNAIAGSRRRYGRVGVELGAESRLGMPAGDFLRLRRMIRPVKMVDGSALMRALRLLKSKAEIGRVRHICELASDTFDALPGFFDIGDTESDLVRKFQSDILLRGADKTPYTAIGSGRGGYTSIIAGPTERRLRAGDVFLIDTGSRYGGYFCDFDRNYAIGKLSDRVRRVHDILYRATDAGIAAARPGNTAADVFAAQAKVLVDAGIELGNVGRFGHGLGKILTEPPSNKPGDHTKLEPGMVLTIEPNAMYGRGKILVHEENIVVTADKAELLSRRAPQEMVTIDA